MEIALSCNIGESIPSVIGEAKLAEDLGYTHMWLSEASASRSPFIAASAAAQYTKNLRIGLGLVSPYLYSIRSIVQGLNTLCKNFGERFELCLGPGDVNLLSNLGIQLPRGKELATAFHSILQETRRRFAENKIQTKIWIGAQGPVLLSTSHLYDGVLINQSNIDLIAWSMMKLRQPLPPGYKIGVFTASNIDGKIRETKIRKVALIIALGASDEVLKQAGVYEEVRCLRRLQGEVKSLESLARKASDELVKQFSMTLPPQKVPKYVGSLMGIGVSHIVFGYPQIASKVSTSTLANVLAAKGFLKRR